MLLISHEIEGTVAHRNRMGKTSLFRIRRDDDSEVMVRFSRALVGDGAYDLAKQTSLGDRLRVTGTFMPLSRPLPPFNEVLEVKTVEAA